MKTRLACILGALAMAAGTASANVAPIGPDFVSAAPRMHIDRSLVASSTAMNRIDPLDVVGFARNSSMLSGEAVAQVDAAAKWLKRHPDHRIVLEGHADRRGSDLYNEDLSTRRIQAVRNRLIGWGVKADRIVMITYGEEEALDPGHLNDRRVVMFASTQQPQQIIAQQLEHRDVVVAVWTDRDTLMQLQPDSPPIRREVVGRR